MQGDIIAIYNASGDKCAEYTYDSWGQVRVTNIIGTIGEINPFRYRSYYYDEETGLYYLKSRYYDPETGRFINADDISYLNPESINGLNLYAYCLNNPVMMVDHEGNMPKWLQWTLGILIVVAAIALSVVTVGAITPLLAPLGAAVGGGLLGSVVVGAVAGAVGGAIAGFGVSIGMQGISNGFENINWSQVGKDTLVGALSGAVAGGIFGGIKHVMSASKLANSISGLSKAATHADDAALALKMTPLIEKGGSMAAHEIAYNASKVAIENLNRAQQIYNVAYFAIDKGYALAKFGLKQFIGYGMKGWF